MILRRGHLSDLPSVYEVCHQTGRSGQDASPVVADRSLIGQYFAAPYLVRDPSWCWIAADDRGVAGYLVATPDSTAFAAWMNTEWLPAVRTLFPAGRSGLTPTEAWLHRVIHEPAAAPPLAAEYPAHLHIDFLPRAQGQGLGRRLFGLFEERLRAEGVEGYHLGVGTDNENAIGFYAKLGLEELERRPAVVFLGRKL